MSKKQGEAYTIDKIDTDNITFSSPHMMGSNKSIFINYDTHVLKIKTPVLNVNFDINVSENNWGKKYEVTMELNPDKKKTKEFMDFLSTIDEQIVNNAAANSKEWFNKKTISNKYVKENYTPIVKQPSNSKYNPNFRVKLPAKDGIIATDVYDMEKKEITSVTEICRLLKRGAQIKLVMSCGGIWFYNGRFGCSWKAEQIRIMKESFRSGQNTMDGGNNGGGTRSYMFLDDNSKTTPDMSTIKKKTKTTGKTDTTSNENEEKHTIIIRKPKNPKSKSKKKSGNSEPALNMDGIGFLDD
jgi:hypothetical protein